MTIPNKRVAILSPVAWRTPPRQYGAWETVASNITEGQSYTQSATVALPALTDGNYFVFVVTDATQNVLESPDEGNNVLLASQGVAASWPWATARRTSSPRTACLLSK